MFDFSRKFKLLSSFLVGFGAVVVLNVSLQLVVDKLALQFPVALLGLLLLTLLYVVLGRVPTSLIVVSTPLLKYLVLFLVPSLTASAAYLTIIEKEWFAVIIALFVATFVSMLFTLVICKLCIKQPTT